MKIAWGKLGAKIRQKTAVSNELGGGACAGSKSHFGGVRHLAFRLADSLEFAWLLGEREKISLGGIELGKVTMVDPRFAVEFALWSNDQVEARYLVHPAYVEKLMAVEQAFAGEKIRCIFNGGQLIVALESGNLFESGSLEPDRDRDLLATTIDQFSTLVDLAAELNERAR